MDYPKYVKVNDKKYAINTDFRVAIECNRIAEDTSIGDFERVLAIIYTLFGDEGINAQDDYEKLLELAVKYLGCGKKAENDNTEEPDMDFEQDTCFSSSHRNQEFLPKVLKHSQHSPQKYAQQGIQLSS